jgi:hypothetical protein
MSEFSVQAHGSPIRSTFYHRLPEPVSPGDQELGDLRLMTLPSDGALLLTKLDLDGAAPPEQRVQSAGLALDVAAGTLVRLSVADALADDEGRRFRAKELDPVQISEFAPELAGGRVFALGPFEAALIEADEANAPAVVRIENSSGWEPGSAIRVLALGTYLDPDWLKPASFDDVGVARVSEDGASVVFDASESGTGLRYLTWIAFVP